MCSYRILLYNNNKYWGHLYCTPNRQIYTWIYLTHHPHACHPILTRSSNITCMSIQYTPSAPPLPLHTRNHAGLCFHCVMICCTWCNALSVGTCLYCVLFCKKWLVHWAKILLSRLLWHYDPRHHTIPMHSFMLFHKILIFWKKRILHWPKYHPPCSLANYFLSQYFSMPFVGS